MIGPVLGLLLAGGILADVDAFGVPKGDPNITPFIVLMLVGAFVAAFGHLIKSSTLIASGLGMMFLGVLVLPLITHWSGS